MVDKAKKREGKETTTKKEKVSTRSILKYSKPLKNFKHEQFCQEYIVCLNATDAYQTSYPKCSTRTARSNGSELLTKTNILARLGHLQVKLSEESGVKLLDIIMGFKKIAFGTIGKTLTNKHKLRALENLGKHLGFFEKHNKQITDAFGEMVARFDGQTRGLPK